MKDVFKTPFEDSDPESETEVASESDEDEDVSMRSVARAYEQNNMDTSESDASYVESGSSGSEAEHSSDSSMASSVSTDAKSEVSEVSVSEADEDEDESMASVKDDGGKTGSPKSRCYSLLFKEINEEQLNSNLPTTCELVIEDPNDLSKLQIRIIPEGGYWQGGIFQFTVSVPEAYNAVPPEVKCSTKVFHPNISEDGTVGLHIIRQIVTEDGSAKSGWNSKLKLQDVMLGINSLFMDPVNVDDALNSEAAKLFEKDKEEFAKRVMDCIKAIN